MMASAGFTAPSPDHRRAGQDLRSLLALVEEGVLRTLICVSLEPRPRTVGALRILPWRDFLDALWAREFH